MLGARQHRGEGDVERQPLRLQLAAGLLGLKLKAQGLTFDVAFTSVLTRAQHPLDLMLAEIEQTGLPTTKNLALNERDYGGGLSALNKDDARKNVGEDQVLVWRRSHVPPPGGESLKVYAGARAALLRAGDICPACCAGQRTSVAAHGDSLRALIVVLEKLTPEQILKRELATGVPVIYRLNADSTVATKDNLAAEASDLILRSRATGRSRRMNGTSRASSFETHCTSSTMRFDGSRSKRVGWAKARQRRAHHLSASSV